MRESETRWESFISEHTAEFLLVPRLVNALAEKFAFILPMFFWSTREGNKIALRSMAGKSVKIISVFARRPKVTRHCREHITMKVNNHLLSYATTSAEVGIPVLAGMPLVSDFSGLSSHVNCCWIELTSLPMAECDYHLTVNRDGSQLVANPGGNICYALADSRICEIAEGARSQPWESAIESLRMLANNLTGGRFPFGFIYKPFQVVLAQG